MLATASLGALPRGLVIAAFTAIVGSLLAWFVGNQVTYRWDERKRRRESDLAALSTFYESYGKWFATWKLWDASKRFPRTTSPPQDVKWRLLERASEVEGALEALLVKLASERSLNQDDRLQLACFRESYQCLRERIREDKPLGWLATGESQEAREYRAFKGLSEYVAYLLEAGQTRQRSVGTWREAIENLLGATMRKDVHDDWWAKGRSAAQTGGHLS